MSNKRVLGIALAVSLLANVIVAASGTYALHRRGGLEYLKAHWSGIPFSKEVSPVRPARQSLFQLLAPPHGGHSIVFLGDSITEFCEWTDLLGVPVINRGISGDTTGDVLSRLDTVSKIRPDSVFLMVGINDALYGTDVATAAENYRQIIRGIRTSSPNTILYIQSVLPVSPPMVDGWLARGRGSQINQWVRAMNQQIRNFAEDKSVVFIDLRDDLSKRGELDPRYSVDGLHLNGAGYEVWKRKLSPFLPPPDTRGHLQTREPSIAHRLWGRRASPFGVCSRTTVTASAWV
jgi:lysophospholipase L1-like esterase